MLPSMMLVWVSSTIASTPAVVNAVVDALSDLGVRDIEMPLSPERVWQAVRDAGVKSGPNSEEAGS